MFDHNWLGCTVVIGTLLLSGCGARTSPAPVILLNSQPTEESGGYTDSTYTVQAGDTLFGIAWYTGNDYRDIAQYNGLSAPYRIFPGQTLRLTAPAAPKPISAESNPGVIVSPAPRQAVPSVAFSSTGIVSTPPTQNTGLTTEESSQRVIDPHQSQKYGESENLVNKYESKCDKNSSQSVNSTSPNGFPDKVSCWVWPAVGEIVETFDNAESGNKGVDIAGPLGSDVVAAADGKVVYSGSALRGYGNLVIIKHTDSFLSAYAYNDTILVNERDWVVAGQKIATMGSSGTDSVRLHFEVRYRGKSLDPLKYLPKQ